MVSCYIGNDDRFVNSNPSPEAAADVRATSGKKRKGGGGGTGASFQDLMKKVKSDAQRQPGNWAEVFFFK
jgi:hypothetical protein